MFAGVALASPLAARAADTGGSFESAPFSPPRVEADTATVFTRLPSEATGITAVNRYDDPQMWGTRYPEFAFGSVGTGVAIGDYDGDGRPDVFVVCKTGPNHLYRNLGDWRFEDVTEAAGVGGGAGAWNQGVVFVDVNNDGRLDLFVGRCKSPCLLYLNRGDGTFAESAKACGLDVVDATASAAFCDYDRDGWLDLYLVTNLHDYAHSPEGEADRLFRNRGDGTFAEVTRAAGIAGKAQGHSAVWIDPDDDGWPDVYVTNDYGWPDQLWHNNGDGTFRDVLAESVPCLPRFSMGVDAGDVNNDGRLDLIVPDMMPTTRLRDQRSLADARAHSVDLSDPSLPTQTMRNALLLDSGTGQFQEAAYLAGLAATDWTWSVLLEDFDSDGRLDLHVTNGMIREYFDFDLRMRLESAAPSEVPRIVKSVPVLRERHFAFRSAGRSHDDLRFEEVGAAWGLDETGVSFGAAVGDLDGDGDLDLVYANYEAAPSVYRNDATGAHAIILALRGTVSNRFGIGATVRIETEAGIQVRRISCGRGYASSSEPVAHFGLGAESRVRRVRIQWPSGHVQTLDNLVADRRYVVTEPDTPSPPRPGAHGAQMPETQFVEVGATLGLAIMARSVAFDELSSQPLLAIRHDRIGPGIAIGDLDGDGRDDVVISGTGNSRPTIRLAGADGAFVPAPGADALARVSPLPHAAPLVLDVDGDGRNDLLLPAAGVVRQAGDPAYRPEVLLNRGGDVWSAAAADILPPLTESLGPAVAADFDRDGRLDVFLGGRVIPGRFPEAPRSFILANRGGKFVDVTTELAPGLARVGLVSGALWSDVDGDGWLDLLLALEWGSVRCWRNIEGRHFEDVSDALGFSAAGSGWWNSVCAADFNGDGRLDYAAGNLGLNTRYRASPEKPAILLSGQFDDTGRPQLIEVEHDGDRLVPVRSRASLGRAMPWILRRFPTAKAYAVAALEDVFSPERIAAAGRWTATEFRSGVFLSQSGGGFRFVPLPHWAQIAPVFGIVAGDCDGDGRADLIVAQNSHAPIAEVGRFTGGLGQLLLGDGRGGFTCVPPTASGIVVPGDAKAVATLDLDRDGWPEILVTRNNARSLLFGNTGVAGRQSLRIALRGRAGNPGVVGARITVHLADGTTQTAEIAAGSGYLSQSTAACFFGFPEKNPPQRIVVRWPWGEVTEHAGPKRGGSATIAAPR